MTRLLLILTLVLFAAPLAANPVSFNVWLNDFTREAIARGVRPDTVYNALNNIYPDEGVLEMDRAQPEHTVTAVKYWERVVSARRIERGKAFMRTHSELLSRISDIYGVPVRYIVALLGVESDYGDQMGSSSTIGSLATLAYDGRRAAFFRDELINALKIVDQGHVRAEEMEGSWAGAMGICQFMPSSFVRFAQDFDSDGRTDIWNSVADAAASTANYLRESGWKSGETWGRRVKLKKEIPEEMLGVKVARTVGEWKKLGVVSANGKGLPPNDMRASLIVPDGGEGAAFLVYNNFNILMKWNRSTYFATSVGMLADKL